MGEMNAPLQSGTEKLSRFGRNFNILGAVALGGLAIVIPGPNPALATLTGLNVAQATGFEWVRRRSESNRKPDNA